MARVGGAAVSYRWVEGADACERGGGWRTVAWIGNSARMVSVVLGETD